MDISSWWYGVVGLSITTSTIYVLVVTHITIVSVTVFLHRHSAHRSVDLVGPLKHFFRFWLWLTTGMTTKQWTSIHRKHHAVCETNDDPHSPQIHGLPAILFNGAQFYKDANTKETLERFGKGTPDDWLERNVYESHEVLGIAIMALIDLFLFGSVGIVIWAIQMMWIPFFAAGVINGVGHFWGYRNFECADAATNIIPWGILIGGEELHNNHHTYPNSAKLAVKPWEIDVGWYWICLFQTFGLAKVKSTGPVVDRILGKNSIDMDTTWAVLNDRFRVMARYADEVVAPMVEQEYDRIGCVSKKLVRKAKMMLCRDETLVREDDRHRISEILEASPILETLYRKRIELQEVWSKRGGSSEELLSAFKSWCVEAENSGIEVLLEFVRDLKSYSVPKLEAV